VATVREKKQPVVSGIDGRLALDVAQRIMNSIQVHKFTV
jgi:hypothetical protein